MSRIGNHRVEVQESDDYKFGWQSAERGEPSPCEGLWPSRKPTERQLIQLRGWDDFHDQERRP